MAKRKNFFTFNWAYLIALLCYIVASWIAEGPLFVLVVFAIAGGIVGVYYIVWRWRQTRSS